LIVNKALQEIVLILQAKTWRVAVGTGTTPAWITNETLENEVSRLDATVSLASTYIPDDTLVFEATFTFGALTAISEIGIFCVDTPSFMLTRLTFSPLEIPANIPFPVKIGVPIRRP